MPYQGPVFPSSVGSLEPTFADLFFAGIADLFAGDWTKPNTIPDAPCIAYLPTFG